MSTLPFPDFEHLSERHPLLSDGLSLMLAEAARVELHRHHAPPAGNHTATTDLTVACGSASDSYTATWRVPSIREQGSHANVEDATRDGAYCLAIAAVEAHFNKFALGRTQAKSGADFWVDTDRNAEFFEDADRVRLEVSGTDAGGESIIKYRLSEKAEQLKSGSVKGPGIAAVVGFREAKIALRQT